MPTAASAGVAASVGADAALPQQTLNQDDFLKLLVAQMSSQDPLNPQSDTDFVAQMAQFTSLEQSRSMQSDMAQMRSDQDLLQANALLGRTVQLQSGDQPPVTGLVSAVDIQAGTPKLVVDGQPYDLSEVLAISPTAANT